MKKEENNYIAPVWYWLIQGVVSMVTCIASLCTISWAVKQCGWYKKLCIKLIGDDADDLEE